MTRHSSLLAVVALLVAAAPASRALAPIVTHDLDVQGLFKVGFFVDDLDRAVAALRGRGVPLAFGPFPARDGVPANAAIRDPEGNYLQLFGRRP